VSNLAILIFKMFAIQDVLFISKDLPAAIFQGLWSLETKLGWCFAHERCLKTSSDFKQTFQNQDGSLAYLTSKTKMANGHFPR